MKTFRWKSLCIALICSVVFAGCSTQEAAPPASEEKPQSETPSDSQEASAEQTLNINMGSEPTSIDPGIAQDIPSMAVARAAFDGLLRLGTDGELHEAVAESYEVSEDQLTWTFHLRDTKWSNGDPVTAHDFEYAWKRVLDPATGSGYAYQMYYLKNGAKANSGEVPMDEVGVKAVDDKTLVVTLENPSPFFPQLVASVTYFPVNKKVVEANEKWANEADTYVVNGPFVVKEWEHKSKIVFEKNENYWDKDNVHLSSMTFHMIEDANTELSMFESGQLDWAGSPLGDLPLDALPTLQESGKMQTQATAGTYWYVFNTEKVPFNNKKIRQAFAYAINRQEIVENVLMNNGEVALGILPPSMWFKPDGHFKDGDVETAKKLLAEGMQELGISELPELEILYNTSEEHQRIATVIQDQWRKAFGIEVKLKNVENKVRNAELEAGNYMIGRASWIGDFNDPVNFLEVFRDVGGTNDTRWHNERFKQLLLDSAQESDKAARDKLLAEADEILMEELPVVPIYYYTYAWVKKDSVKDVVIDALGFIDFKYASNAK
ncbi:peptide ABC transporter substrate-binding protein [Brevibacillus humidisoli]|uniref:peptide ABC transporter substrate-binding protein n=1 Tax=Brevibacillus humidisoli TaxID=2895522 RepID=UPI001E658A9E|nr:peptide ABC transporter substrate-binding protein [Brevibacillus humidisoli]UFJ42388.1 peptide ABC transporter substrate-binding protein [Brevibacillus humidisoli]